VTGDRDRYTAGEAAPPAQPFGRTVAHDRTCELQLYVAFGVRGAAGVARSVAHRPLAMPYVAAFVCSFRGLFARVSCPELRF
jgi:hypothetical protein